MSDNSHYSIIKELLTTFDQVSKLQHSRGAKMNHRFITLPSLTVQVSTNLRSEISNSKSRVLGGGEGTRTPDPRVANAVLCQLSYTPDKPTEI